MTIHAAAFNSLSVDDPDRFAVFDAAFTGRCGNSKTGSNARQVLKGEVMQASSSRQLVKTIQVGGDCRCGPPLPFCSHHAWNMWSKCCNICDLCTWGCGIQVTADAFNCGIQVTADAFNQILLGLISELVTGSVEVLCWYLFVCFLLLCDCELCVPVWVNSPCRKPLT